MGIPQRLGQCEVQPAETAAVHPRVPPRLSRCPPYDNAGSTGVELVFQLMDGLVVASLAAECPDQLDGRADLVEGVELKDLDVFNVLDAGVGVLSSSASSTCRAAPEYLAK